jgi:hypothetical protein
MTEDLLDPVVDLESPRSTWSEVFQADGFVPLTGLLGDERLAALLAEVQALRRSMTRRDLVMRSMGDTPRHMRTIGADEIDAIGSDQIASLYASLPLLTLLDQIVGERVERVPHSIERYVVNTLDEVGDTHGGHVDDYPLALVMILEAPPAAAHGACLEFLPAVPDLHDLDWSTATRAFLRPGDAYLLAASAFAHRVTPLVRPGRRTVLNMGFTTASHVVVESDSAAELYGT